jgi:putative membrane protein (TIGR04086 family)
MAVLTGFVVDIAISALLSLLATPQFYTAPNLAQPGDLLLIGLLALSTGIGGFVAGRMAGESRTINGLLVAVVGTLLLFYVIGIVYWLIPYLFLSLVLLLISFRSTERVLKMVYLLSPLLMAIVILIVVTTLTITPPEGSLLVSDLTSNFQDSVGTGVLFAGITLVWGYICVSLGFGGYKLLQHFGMIKEEKRSFLKQSV